MTHNKFWTIFLSILILVIFCFLVDIPRLPNWVPLHDWFTNRNVYLGLDLQGGTQLIYQADVSGIPKKDQNSAVNGIKDVISRRISQAKLSGTLGVLESRVQVAKNSDKWRVIVELPGIKDVNKAINLIGETPILDFREQVSPKQLTVAEKKNIADYNQNAEKKAKEILAEVKKGENFSELAKQYSDDPGSKDKGGDLGWFGRGKMIPSFEKAVFDELKVGQISGLVRTTFGYHIIKKTGERKNANDEPEVRASHILIATTSEEAVEKATQGWKYTGLTGKQLKRAYVNFNPQSNEPEVSLEFNSEGAKLFGDITSRNIGKPVAIFLDNSPLSTPLVKEAITSGKAVITGRFTVKQAKDLARRLSAGALAVPIKLVSQQNIGPSLGKASVNKSFIAGLLGLLVVMILMLSFYGKRGFIASIALIIYVIITFALYKLVPVTLTLSGIAGFVLSIGMAVDANVLIFERIKDEERLGKGQVASFNDGFAHAWTAIRDGNVTTLIVCFILYQFTTGLVRGFGLTLGIGVLVSMFTAIVVTKTLLRFTLLNKTHDVYK